EGQLPAIRSEDMVQVISPDSIPSGEFVRAPTIIQTLAPTVLKTLRKGGVMAAIETCQQISAEVAAALSSTNSYRKQIALNRARRGLDALRQSAVLALRGQESRVFAQVAQQWLDAVNAEIDRLTEEDRIAERIPNPYLAPNPLSPGSNVFVGRTEVFRFVEEHFLKPGQNVPIVLYGQPRIGKSSLLRHFDTRLLTDLIPVYIDMQRTAQVESTGGLLFNLSDAIATGLRRRGLDLPAPSLGDYATEPFIVSGKFLDRVEAAINAPEYRLILALDEFEEIEKKLTEGKVSQDLMPFLRNIMQHREGIALLFAGTHTLDEIIQDYWVPYFRSAVPCRVTYLDEADARKLITEPIEGFPLNYEPEAVDFILETTRCHPCLIQLACMALVDLKNEQHSRHASLEDAKQAVTKVLATGDYVFHGIWDWIPRRERALLSALAVAEQGDIEALARASNISQDEVRSMIERLIEAEVVEAEETTGTEYRFQVNLFRRWVQRHAARAGIDVRQPVLHTR
ncbi:MAG: ATP-binding protein, partial [Blastocatellia bacterium]|nr:ATP-binding protein [Blastocatellia bacterium]